MDELITTTLNAFVGKSPGFDGFLATVATNPIAKGLPIPVIFLFLWFRQSPDLQERRRMLLATIFLAIFATLVGRLLAMSLPFRVRPLQSDVTLTVAPWVKPEHFDGWSSLPSDHAVFYFALSTAFWMINRRAGLLMALQATIVVVFARVYFSLHWTTDILVGASVGILIVVVLMHPISRAIDKTGLLHLGEAHPEIMHPLIFAILFQMATMFKTARRLLLYLVGDGA